MEVILREHVDNLGKRGEVVKVADGYARNYLLPRQIALPVTAANRRRVEREHVLMEAKETDEKNRALAVAERLNTIELVVARKVGENEALFGSVTAADIAAGLAAHQIEVEKRRVMLPEPIKRLGAFAVPIKVHREVTAEINVRVVKEE
jgi:large subunit ribosomal protein L9